LGEGGRGARFCPHPLQRRGEGQRTTVRDPIAFPVDDPSRPGEVRRAAVALAAALEFPEDARGRIALVATEAATNLVKHATGGEVVLRALSPAEGGGIEVLALDRGPGIADV